MVYIHAMEYNIEIKMNEQYWHVTTWINFSKHNVTQKKQDRKCSLSPLIQYLKAIKN